MKENSEEKLRKAREAARKRALAEELCRDFEERREARRQIEQGWRVNMNFVSGNQ